MTNDLTVQEKRTPMEAAKKLFELKALEKEIKKEIEKNNEILLQTMQENDVLTLKTGNYTIVRAVRRTPKVENMARLKKSLTEENIPFKTEMQEVFDEYTIEALKMAAKEGRELDGLEVKETEYVSVKVNK